MASLLHARSLSLPSQTHPAISQFDDSVSRLRSSEATCSSLSSTNSRVNGLRNLYESIDDLLMLPHIQQQIVSDEYVGDCISVLDGCSTVRDVISLVKEDVRSLLSAVRRKDVGGINAYVASRRNSKKMIQKSLKKMRRGASAVSCEERTLVSMLKEAESAALSTLKSLLSYTLGMTRQEKKSSSWSLVSKLMHSKTASDEENEFNKVDSLLKQSREIELVNHLKEMDSSIQVLEEDLESVFRQLIKTRVALLNILNH